MAIETGISPQELLALDSTMFNAFLAVFRDRAERMKPSARRH